MNRYLKRAIFTAGIILLLATKASYAECLPAGLPCGPERYSQMEPRCQWTYRPNFFTAAADAILARPLLLVTTVAGTAVFIGTLPFSYLSGSVCPTAKVLIADPAYQTFQRPLGCYPPNC